MKFQKDFKDLFYNNQEIRNNSVKKNLKNGAQMIQQKEQLIPIHLQDQVAQKLKRLIKHGYQERATELTKDKSVKIALDSRNSSEETVNRKVELPYMEELISRI